MEPRPVYIVNKGRGKYRRTGEHRAKAAQALKGRPKSPEHKANIAAAMQGHKVSAQTRAKLALAASPYARSKAIRALAMVADALKAARGL